MLYTRLNIYFAVSMLSKYQLNQRSLNLVGVKHILIYLRNEGLYACLQKWGFDRYWMYKHWLVVWLWFMKLDFKICVYPRWWKYILSVSIISLERYRYVRSSSRKNNLCKKSGWNLFPSLALEWLWITLKGDKCRIYGKLSLRASGRLLGFMP